MKLRLGVRIENMILIKRSSIIAIPGEQIIVNLLRCTGLKTGIIKAGIWKG